jgi:prolyl oligopeptidase
MHSQTFRSIIVNRRLLFFLIALFTISTLSSAADLTPPSTDKIPVTDTYHNAVVADDYRWLENFDDLAVKDWNAEQNAFTRSKLDQISARNAIQRQLTELLGGSTVDYNDLHFAGGKLFARKYQPPAQQPFLITLESPDDLFSEEVILDVNKMNPDGTTSMDFYQPTMDGRLVAVSLSEKGSEKGTVRVFEVATGRELGDTVLKVNGPTAGGDVAWLADNSGFFYTRYPHKGERPDEDLSFYQQVYFHKLGTPNSEDTYVIGKDFLRIAEIELEESDDHRLFLAEVKNGDGGELAHYYRDAAGVWTQVTKFSDLIPTVRFAPDNSLYLLSRKNAPKGKILRLAPGVTDLASATTVVNEGGASIRSFLVTKSYIYLTEIDGGPLRLRVLTLGGQEHYSTPLEPIRSIGGVFRTHGENVLMRVSSYTENSAWYAFDPESKTMTRTALFKTSTADFSDTEVIREFATSKDGTKVPLNIIRRKGTKLDGKNPTILYGYGGYGICLSPGYDPVLRLWLDQGGVYAIANLRGGGEYGEEWHLAGNLTKKQNGFDDFAPNG